MPYTKPSHGTITNLTGCCAMYLYYGFPYNFGTSPLPSLPTCSSISLPNLQEGYGRSGGILATTNSQDQPAMEALFRKAGWLHIGAVRSRHADYPVNHWLMDLSGKEPQPLAPGPVVEKIVEIKPKRTRKTDAVGRPATKAPTKAPRKRGPAPLSF